ncbi:leucine-rich repeat-containing protein 51-like [Babylonia areolata]|uniref:leucine-rich repeat-containing protein 51-like n=1 Tax=Babylonia areolata TaxID=304850 RepID=UPI003FCF8B77
MADVGEVDSAERQGGEQRIDTKDPVTDVIDYSFMRLTTVEDAEAEEPRPKYLGKGGNSKSDSGKFIGPAIRMGNNQLSEIATLFAFAEKWFMKPLNMAWIDLSFNALTKIDPVLVEFENLQILYLHGNNISGLQEVDKLGQLTKLRKVMLHGNAIEKEKGYRYYVISALPGLRNLDGSAVTKNDVVSAGNWRKMNNPGKKKKKIQSED